MNLNSIKAKVGKRFFSLCTMISPKLNTALRYRRTFGKRLNFDSPQTLNEKVLWLKLNTYYKNPLVIQCADKYLVREYVSKCGLDDILIPLIGSYSSPADIPWNELPQRFVLKWNFGATMNIICRNKQLLDEKASLSMLEKWGKCKYWLPFSEMQYKYINKKIVCEEYISSDESDELPDYKFYCFNGVPKYVMICTGRTNGTKSVHANYLFMDENWEIQPYSAYAINNPNITKPKKPEGFEYALQCAKTLSRPFPFVRADFYIVDGKVYFGELTFTPAGGLDTDLFTGDMIMGEKIKLQ